MNGVALVAQLVEYLPYEWCCLGSSVGRVFAL